MSRPSASHAVVSSLVVALAATLVVLLAAPSAAPAQPARAGRIAGLPTKMAQRVVGQLRAYYGVAPRVVASAHETQADGGERVVVLFERSRYDQCVFEASSADERAECRELQGTFASCTTREIAVVLVAPTPAGTAAGTGGALTDGARVRLDGGCRLDRLLSFERRDVDGDDRPEVVVDFVTLSRDRDERTMTPVTTRARHLRIFRDDLTPQFAPVSFANWGQDNFEATTSSRAARWSFTTDAPHAAVRVEYFDYEEAGGCHQGRDGWMTPADPEEEDECAGTVHVETHAWDAATDSYP